jgi:hypothetical protein
MVTVPEPPAVPALAPKWPDLVPRMPKDLPKLDQKIDVAFLVELGGAPEVVERRVQLVRDIVGKLQAEADSPPAVQAAVFGYREHEGQLSNQAKRRRESLVIGRGMGSTREILRTLRDEKLWRAVEIKNGRVAPVEDALDELRSESWRPGTRHVMCIIGSRPPARTRNSGDLFSGH